MPSDYAGWSEVNAALFETLASATKSPPLQIRRHCMYPTPGSPPVRFAQSSSDGGSREPTRDGYRREVASTMFRARPFPAHAVPSVLLAVRSRSLFSEPRRHSALDASRVRACRIRSAGRMRSGDAREDSSLHRCTKPDPSIREIYYSTS